MIRIPCPFCGARDHGEFRYAGTMRPRPAPQTATPADWRRYLYERDDVAGWVTETWYHAAGCGRFVTVTRHTVTNEVAEDLDDGPLRRAARHRADPAPRPADGATTARRADPDPGPGPEFGPASFDDLNLGTDVHQDDRHLVADTRELAAADAAEGAPVPIPAARRAGDDA